MIRSGRSGMFSLRRAVVISERPFKPGMVYGIVGFRRLLPPFKG